MEKKKKRKRKEHYKNGKLKLEGEYLNGVKWNGKGCDKNVAYELNGGKGLVQLYYHFGY